MAEVAIVDGPEEAAAAAEWVKARMTELGAVAGDAICGVVGSVDAAMLRFALPDGTCIECWSDNYSALSLRGDAGLIARLAAEYREVRLNG